MREEFGFSRTTCGCQACVTNCRFMPGFLIPSDLERMIPKGVDPFQWAEENLRASPGAVVADSQTGRQFNLSTLVPASNADGECIHLTPEQRCDIHEISPFGCAFFDCRPERGDLSQGGLIEVAKAIRLPEPRTDEHFTLYYLIWIHLAFKGLKARPPSELRAKMQYLNIGVRLGIDERQLRQEFDTLSHKELEDRFIDMDAALREGGISEGGNLELE